MAFSVEKIDDLMHITVFHNVVVLLMTGTMKAAHTEPLARYIEDTINAHPRGVVVSSMLAASVPAPGLELRAHIRSLYVRFGDRLLLGMPIVDERGIFAAARRAFMRGLLLILGGRKLTVAGSVEDAARLAAPFANKADGSPIPVPELLALFRFCESHFGEK